MGERIGESWECMHNVRNILPINRHNQNIYCQVVVFRQGIHSSCKYVIMSMVRIYMYKKKASKCTGLKTYYICLV